MSVLHQPLSSLDTKFRVGGLASLQIIRQLLHCVNEYRDPTRMQQMSTIAGLSRPFYRSSDISCLSLPHCIAPQRTSRSPPDLPLRYFTCSKFFKSYLRSCRFVDYPLHPFLRSLAGCTKSSELAESRCFGLGGGSRRSGRSRMRYGIWLSDGESVLHHHV